MVDWKQAGHDAKRKKARNEGLSDPSSKKKIYDVMKVYSKIQGFTKPTCFCCKNSDWKFLAFDHTNKQLRQKHKGLNGHALAKRLERDNYPKQIQILCHNCNTGKEIFGGKNCPHKLSVKGQAKLRSVGLPVGKIITKIRK